MVTVLKPTTHLICVVIYTVSTVQRKRRKEIEPDMVTEETDRQLTIQESKIIVILIVKGLNIFTDLL